MKRIVYKLTASDNKTRPGFSNETQWGEVIEHTAHGNGEMCSDAFIHAYSTPLLAVLMNSIHGNYNNPNLWRCVALVKRNDGTKLGCTSLRTIKQIELPKVTTKMRVAFGIHCALKVYKEPSFVIWAKGWLSGKNRTYAAAADTAAAYATAYDADANADAAAYAAYAAAAAYDAAAAANAAAYAAYTAAYAADAAAATLNFSFILRASRRALKY